MKAFTGLVLIIQILKSSKHGTKLFSKHNISVNNYYHCLMLI